MTALTNITLVLGIGFLVYIITYFLMAYLEKPKHPRLANIINVIGGFLLVILLAGTFFYFFIISPAFVEKPYVEKPPLDLENMQPGDVIIKDQHIKYIVTEMGGYRLHDDPLTKSRPEAEFYLTDINKTYYIMVINNEVYISEEKPQKSDARIYTTQETMIQLFQHQNFNEELVNLVKQGNISADILADKTSLALKGYLALYNEVNK